MLRDPRVKFGLWMIKGPLLSRSRFYVNDSESRGSNQSPLKKFLTDQITRFWRQSAARALQAIEWGWSASEVLYTIQKDQVVFDTLNTIHPMDARVVSLSGKKVGVAVRNVPGKTGRIYIGGAKSFWHIHDRGFDKWYGRTRLEGAFGPWREMQAEGGSVDIRRLYYHKYAYNGDVIYYPTGHTPDELGNLIPNVNIARDITEKRKTGGITAIPNVVNPNTGAREWEIVTGGSGGTADVISYNQELKNELFEGMGIPPEVVEAGETGSGYAGRRVPQEAFYGTLQELANWLIHDFDQQILRELVYINFGSKNIDYDIVPFDIMTAKDQEQTGQVPGSSPVPAEAQMAAQFAVAV